MRRPVESLKTCDSPSCYSIGWQSYTTPGTKCYKQDSLLAFGIIPLLTPLHFGSSVSRKIPTSQFLSAFRIGSFVGFLAEIRLTSFQQLNTLSGFLKSRGPFKCSLWSDALVGKRLSMQVLKMSFSISSYCSAGVTLYSLSYKALGVFSIGARYLASESF